MRDTRSQIWGAPTTVELQSSDSPRVTTETTIGSPAGENSKASLAHVPSPCHTTRAPASNVDLNSVSTRADKVKSPASGPTSPGAFRVVVPERGSMNQSERGPAVMERVASSRLASTGAPIQRSVAGTPGTVLIATGAIGPDMLIRSQTVRWAAPGPLIRPAPARFGRVVGWCTSESRLPPT